jgi:nucleotide-binding universal stress UspA family protein
MKNILVPVDFSETSTNALMYAIQLFGKTSVEYTVMTTYKASTSSSFQMKSIDNILERDAEKDMEDLIKTVKKAEPETRINTKIIKSYAIAGITSLGDSGDYDYIVMGTKGASGLKEVFIGSVAGGVIANTKAPVIVVPAGFSFDSLEEIVFAIGDNPLSDPKTVEPLREIVDMTSAKLSVFHISEKREFENESIMQTIADLNPSLTVELGTGDVNKHINQYLGKTNAGLLCMIRGKKGFLNRLMTESVTKKQTFNSPIPLLVLH